MQNWIDEQIARERYRDLMRAEQHSRMVDIVLSARRRANTRVNRFYNPMLARVGRWLVAWGCILETRYGTVVGRQ